MKRVASLFLFAILLFGTGTLANSQCPSSCLFYGGDFDPNNPNANGLANETDLIVGGNPYGAATYQNFINSQNWNITGLFTNNLSSISPSSGYWEIRSGMSEGNDGTLIASGTQSGGNFSQTNRSQRIRLHRVHRFGHWSQRHPRARHVLVRDGSGMPDLQRPFIQQQQS